MASVEELLIKIIADNTDLKKKLSDSENSVNKFGGIINKLGPMIAGAFTVAAITTFAKTAYNAYEQQEKANRRLMFAVRGNTAAYSALAEQASRLQAETAIHEETIQQVQMLGISAGRSVKEVKMLVEASIALSSATGVDLQSAYLQLSQTLNGQMGRLLPKMGTDFANLTKEQLQNGDAIRLLVDKYDELGKKSATTLDKLKTQSGELIELIGTKAANSNLGAVTSFAIESILQMSAPKAPYSGPNPAMHGLIPEITQFKKLAEAINDTNKALMTYDELMTLETNKREKLSQYDVPIAGRWDLQGQGGDVSSMTPRGMPSFNVSPLQMKALEQTGVLTEENTGKTLAYINAINTLTDSFVELGATGKLSLGELVAAELGGVRQVINAKMAEAMAKMIAGESSKGLLGLVTASAGLALLQGMFSKIPAFANGGIVGGNSTVGDRVTARVNSGEMILNSTQQAQLFAMANGGGGGGRLYATIRAGDIYLSNKRGAYLSKRRGI